MATEELLESEVVWGWASHAESEVWSGAYSLEATVERAIEEARSTGAWDVYIAAGQYPSTGAIAATAIRLDDVLERMEEDAADQGIYAADELLFEPSPAAAEKLEEALRAWGADAVTAFDRWTRTGEPVRIVLVRADCGDCGVGVKVDEDGCCAQCGRDAEIVVPGSSS